MRVYKENTNRIMDDGSKIKISFLLIKFINTIQPAPTNNIKVTTLALQPDDKNRPMYKKVSV